MVCAHVSDLNDKANRTEAQLMRIEALLIAALASTMIVGAASAQTGTGASGTATGTGSPSKSVGSGSTTPSTGAGPTGSPAVPGAASPATPNLTPPADAATSLRQRNQTVIPEGAPAAREDASAGMSMQPRGQDSTRADSSKTPLDKDAVTSRAGSVATGSVRRGWGGSGPGASTEQGLERCYGNWDPTTHMSRATWNATCRRLIANGRLDRIDR
jgi:hypothetical protein